MAGVKIKRLRWWMIALLMLGAILNYLTRSTLSVAATTLLAELHISEREDSWITAAFEGAIMLQPLCGLVLDTIGLKLGFALFALPGRSSAWPTAWPAARGLLHDRALAGVRRALPEARVGGSDIAGSDPRVLGPFLEHSLGRGKLLDFVAFHAKGSPRYVDGHARMRIAAQLATIDQGFRTGPHVRPATPSALARDRRVEGGPRPRGSAIVGPRRYRLSRRARNALGFAHIRTQTWR
jgi:hypothetical protein